MSISIKNFFDLPDTDLQEELIELISGNENVKIERIISDGHRSPEGFWYDQETDEFVLLLSGKADLKFEDGTKLEMRKGDFITIPAHFKHRVEKTSTDEKTLWLAVHFKNK